MLEYGTGTSNGFQEKAFLMIVVVVSLVIGEFTTSGWLGLWYAILGCATLYLTWHFDIFSFSSEAWIEKETAEWSQATLGQAPDDYIQAVSNIRDRIVPSHGVFWWFFRVVYGLVGSVLVAIALEKLYYGTDHIRPAFLKLFGVLVKLHLI